VRLPDSLFGAGLAAPAVIATLVLIAYPLGYSLWVSLHEVALGGAHWEFVGLDNYRSVVEDPVFWPSLRRTLLVAAGITLLTPMLGLGFALALNERFRGRGLLRSVLILPWSLSQVTLALTFGWMFNSQFGPVNGLLSSAGADPVTWFANGTTVLLIITIAMVWNLVPFAAVLFLGSLQTVSEDLMRAARVDGAKALQRFALVTFPAIRDTLLVVVVLAALNGFLVFAPIFILTGGGPGTDTTLLAWWGYRTGFRDLELGESAAIFYLMTLIIGLISALTLFSLGRRRDA
jgi:multiple sugar transport system permease protein